MKRLLKRKNLDSVVFNYLDKIETYQKRQKKLEKEKLLDDASAIEPAVKLADGKLFAYLVSAENTDDLMVFVDRFKSLHKDSTVVTISDKNGGFAITSSDGESAQKTFNIMKSAGNARGGGRPTIRGAIPKDKINLVIDGLKKKYEQN